jgi:hypothetical protein
MHLHSEKNLSSDFLNSSSDVFMSRQERLCSKTDGVSEFPYNLFNLDILCFCAFRKLNCEKTLF